MTLNRPPTKLQKLLAVFDAFHTSLEALPGDYSKALIFNWKQTRSFYTNIPEGVRPSKLASGLEEALLEMLMLFEAAPSEQRTAINKAFYQTLAKYHPEFLSKQQGRFEKILAKGRISRESEYYVIRHYVDIYEDNQEHCDLLNRLYQLIDLYESLHSKAV